ncbi:MAG: glycosyltransferase family 4 protein [Chloroflexi bacterium]|nr:glycosyltransferase family 4 protein [Chloroflexota bacterium]
MRVVLLANFGLRRLGTVRARALPLARALVARGHAVHLLVPPWDSPADAGSEWDDSGVHIAHLPTPAGLAWARSVLPLARAARALRPDVVHSFKPIGPGAGALLVLQAWRAVAGRGPALLCDADDWEGSGGWNVRRRGLVRRAAIAAQERLVLQRADGVTVASRALAEIVGHLRRGSVFYVPNGPSVCAAGGPRSAPRARAPVVLLYTRFAEFGLERFAWRWAAVVAREPRARLLLVGRGLAGEERQLADLLAARGLRDTALFTGWLAEDDLPRYLQAADVALYPCDDTLANRTKSPVKLVELLAAGLPVVAEAVGEVPAYLLEGRAGRLVAPGDDEDFVAATLDLLGDDARRTALAAAARAAAAHFAWPRLAERVEAAYAAVLARR